MGKEIDMGRNHHNDAQKRAAEGKPYREPHGVGNRIADSVFGAYGGNANKQNSQAKAGHANGRKQRSK